MLGHATLTCIGMREIESIVPVEQLWVTKDEETFRSLILLVIKYAYALKQNIQFISGACVNDNELTIFVGFN